MWRIFFWSRFCILLLLASYSIEVEGQNNVFYENVFKKEFSNLNQQLDKLKDGPPANKDNNSESRIYMTPQILPDWFINPPEGDQNVFYAIGISDPWIDAKKGRAQAINRANGIASLMTRLHTKGVIETYNNNQDNKFQQISQFIAVPGSTIFGEPVDSFKTKFQEQLFLYKYIAGKPEEYQKNTTIEYFISSDNRETRYNQFEKLKFNSGSGSAKSEYESMEANGSCGIKSILGADTIQFRAAAFRYEFKQSPNKDDNNSEICYLASGLWQAYLKSLVHNLDIAATDISSRMKSLSDNKETEDKQSTYKQLMRTIYDVSFSFSIITVRSNNNQIELHLKSVIGAN